MLKFLDADADADADCLVHKLEPRNSILLYNHKTAISQELIISYTPSPILLLWEGHSLRWLNLGIPAILN